FIVLWLVGQLLLPLSYFTWRDDPFDERFAWRMFSPMRLTRCHVELYVGTAERRVRQRIRDDLHNAWLGWLRRGRATVARAYLAHRCEREREAGRADPWVSMALICPLPDGDPEQLLSRDDNACVTP